MGHDVSQSSLNTTNSYDLLGSVHMVKTYNNEHCTTIGKNKPSGSPSSIGPQQWWGGGVYCIDLYSLLKRTGVLTSVDEGKQSAIPPDPLFLQH